MSIFVLFITVVICSTSATLLEEVDWPNTPPLKSAVQEILLSQNAHEATILQPDIPQDQHASKIVREIAKSIREVRPLKMFTYENMEMFTNLKIISGSWTIFFHVCNTWKVPDRHYLSEMSVVSRRTTVVNHEIRYIMVLITNGEGANFTSIFEHMWSLWYLDFTIIELMMPDLVSEWYEMKVHIYNPFTKAYVVQPYEEGTDWFPDKLRNMNGYPLVGNAFRGIPTAKLVRMSNVKDNTTYLKIEGVVGSSLDALSKVFNFTIVVDEENARSYMHSYNVSQFGRLDMRLQLSSQLKYSRVSKVSSPLIYGKYFLLMPRMYGKPEGVAPWNLIITLVVGVVLIAIFYLCSFVMGFPAHLRHPINIFGLFMGVGFERGPSKLPEKIIFITMVVASTRYVSVLYSEMVSASVTITPEVDVKIIEDIKKTGMIAMFAEPFFNSIRRESKPEDLPFIRNYQDANSTVTDPLFCAYQLRDSRNIICQFPELAVPYGISTIGEAYVKVASYSTPSFPITFSFRLNSPYVDRFNPVLLRIVENGMVKKSLEDFHQEWKAKIKPPYAPFKETPPLDYVPLYYVLVAYLVPVAVCIAEIMWHRYQLRRSNFIRRLTVQSSCIV